MGKEKNDALFADQTVPVTEGAEAFVELLSANDVKYIFYNPGTDNMPVLEAVYKRKSLGRQAPELVLCLHESLAMSAAHGYFMITEKPQVVMVHVDGGTQQVGAALHNAQRGMAGIIFCAGRTPWTFEGERRGSIDIPVQFRQEQLDQAGIVRGFVKWDYELRCNENIHHVVQRAFQIAGTEPHGPVYLILPRELLLEKIDRVRLLPKGRYGPSAVPEANASAIAQAARLLASADSPLAITGYLGRHPQTVAPFVELAESLGMRVVSQGMRMNFPTDHPLFAGESPDPYLKDADVILIIDQQVPYLPIHAQPAPDAKIIYIDIDPVKASYPLWNFPADVRIQADSSRAVPALSHAVRELFTSKDRARCRKHFRRYQEEHETKRAEWQSSALAKARQRPISAEWLAYCIAQEIDDDAIIINETVSNQPIVAHHLHRTKPGSLFRVGGSGLGWGLGLALGAKLATPESTVVCLTTDGSFIFGHPLPALSAANNSNAPFLTIIFNNQGYYAVKRAIIRAYGAESYTAKKGEWKGVEFTPPDFAQVARACGAWGELVEDPAALSPAIAEALTRVRGGQSVVLDVWLERP